MVYHEISCNYCGHPVSRCICGSDSPQLGNIRFVPNQPTQTGDGMLVHDPHDYVQPARDPALRRAILEALRLYDRWQVESDSTQGYDLFCNGMEALREALAK